MAENTTETIIGGIVLAVAIGFVTFAYQSTDSAAPANSYNLTASFRSAQGINVGADVKMAGVKVGTVTGITLDRLSFRAIMSIAVDADLELPDDTAILISSEGLLGGNYVEMVPGGSPDNLTAGDEIYDTQGSVSLVSLLMKFVSGGEE